MRFLVITRRRPGILKGATATQAAEHFTHVQAYFDGLKQQGTLVDEGRLVGQHARFQIFEIQSREALDARLAAAPNTPYVTREIYEVGSVHDAVDRLRAKAGLA